jgi:hypothetical protein
MRPNATSTMRAAKKSLSMRTHWKCGFTTEHLALDAHGLFNKGVIRRVNAEG